MSPLKQSPFSTPGEELEVQKTTGSISCRDLRTLLKGVAQANSFFCLLVFLEYLFSILVFDSFLRLSGVATLKACRKNSPTELKLSP
jgi:hypothetical protein